VITRHRERSEAIQFGAAVLDCFVAALLAMTIGLSQTGFSAVNPHLYFLPAR